MRLIQSFLPVVTLVFCAFCINFSWIQSWNNSDSVIPALISIEKYAPFYWSENRFGMLVPLLASPVHDYGWNVLLQSQIIVFAAISVLLLLDLLTGAERSARAVRAMIAGLLLLVFYKPIAALVLLLPGSPYLVGLCLLLAGLYLLMGSRAAPAIRWSGGGLLLCLCFWVNVSNVVIGAAAVLAWPRSVAVDPRRRASAFALLCGVAFAILKLSSYVPGSDISELIPVRLWPRGLILFAANVPVIMRESATALAILAACAYTAATFRRFRYSPVHAVAIGAGCQIIVTAGSKWVSQNAYDARYVASPLFILLAVALLTLATPIAAHLQTAAGAATATVLGSLVSVVIVTQVFGLPSYREATAQIHQAMSDAPMLPRELGCTHVVGDYWWVWEKVYLDRMITGRRAVWPVTHRSEAIRDGWATMPVEQRKYCAICTDPMIEHMRSSQGVGTFTREAQAGNVCVFRELVR